MSTLPAVAPSTVIGFNYAALGPDAAQIAQDAATRIKAAVRTAYLDAGRQLARVKDLLPHGQFTAWAQVELGMTARTVENYMQAATFVDGKSETVSFLPPTVLYKLAAPSAPPEVVQEVLAAAAAGAPLDARAITAKLDAARDAAKRRRDEMARMQRRSPKLSRAAEARLAKQRDLAAKQAAERAREEQARRARWAPVARRMADAAGADAAAVLAALGSYPDNQDVTAALMAALRSMATGGRA